jgi:hypothetical protein
MGNDQLLSRAQGRNSHQERKDKRETKEPQLDIHGTTFP